VNGVTKRCLFICGVIALLSQCGSSLAQEAALYGYTSAVRFEESPGYFHYILECRDVNGSTSTNVPGTELALCWSVVAAHFQVVDGKIDEKTSNPTGIDGVLKVSKSYVSFVPKNPDPANPERKFATSDVALQHQAGQASGFVAVLAAGKGEFYKFVLVSVCSKCAATPPLPDPAKAGQLDAEFAMISDTIKDFDGSLKRYRELSSHMRLTVSPDNQPGPSATTDSLKRFSELNRDMAEMCSEPAKSCIQTYSRYQACRASDAPTSCGAIPTCSASCTLVPRDYFFKLHAEVRFTPPVAPEVSATAWLSPTTPGSPGVVGMSGGIFGGLGATPSLPARPANATGAVRIASGVVAGLKLTGAAPVYPPVARAAHMQGTVTLHAIISKEGKMERVEVISGPSLLQGAALEAVKQWTYKPYLLNGAPAEVDTTVIVNFNLNGAAGSAPATPPVSPATN
jgi:TonB family protein